MIVGEAPGETEVLKGEPFVGFSGVELNKMLFEAGLNRTECFATNVCQERPPGNDMGEWLVDTVKEPNPDKYKNRQWVRWKGKWAHPSVAAGYDQLIKHIALVRPRLVLAFGNTALFALTGMWGISKWRGSQLEGSVGDHTFKVIPAYHPAAVLRDWSLRPVTVNDLRRAAREVKTGLPYIRPNFDRIIRPSFAQASGWFSEVRKLLLKGPVISSTDIETRAGHISCTGFHIRGLPTICVPWMVAKGGYDGGSYWPEEEERWLWNEVREVMSHPRFLVVGQNWFYDAQYKHRFFFLKKLAHWDTMIAQHCMFPGQPKGLDYIASLYCDFYRFWKDDGKNWDPSMPEEDHWNYNCDDVEITYEVFEKQKLVFDRDARLASIRDFQTNTLGPLLFKAMCRGIRADTASKTRLSKELANELDVRQKYVDFVAGHPLNINSPPQLKKFFYEDLGVRPVTQTKGKDRGKITTNDDALIEIPRREPVLRGLCAKIREMRSLRVFRSTFVEARLDRDLRIRSSYNIGGTVTFRLSSSENAFGSGLNLQNIPSGKEDAEDGDLALPNVRKLFIPDEGMEIFDMDLKNADFYTVVWEADDELFRLALEAGVDMHLLNAGVLFPVCAEVTLERLKDPEFTKYAKKKYPIQRDFAKRWVHGTDYGGGDRTMAATVGITVAENARYRAKWFGEHPGLKRWHERVESEIKTRRYVENRFGYRWNIFDRIEGILPEGLAWVPQATTGCVINRIWDQVDRQVPEAEVLIQVHDSLVGQYPVAARERVLLALQEAAKVVVPYERPLIIPVGMKTSAVSWGHCE
jgi:DNA polymerase-1